MSLQQTPISTLTRLNGPKAALVQRVVQAFQGAEWGEAIGGSSQKFIFILKLFTFFCAVQVMPGYQRVQQNWRRAISLTARISHHHPAPPAPTRVSFNPRPPLVRPVFRPAGNHRAPTRVPFNLAAPPNRPAAASLAPPLRPEVRTSTPVGRSRQRSMSMTSPRALLEGGVQDEMDVQGVFITIAQPADLAPERL